MAPGFAPAAGRAGPLLPVPVAKAGRARPDADHLAHQAHAHLTGLGEEVNRTRTAADLVAR